jgi:predicted RNase H-like HicB family nuclease
LQKLGVWRIIVGSMEDYNVKEDIVIKPVDTGYRLVITAELTPDEEEGGYSVYCPELDIYTQGDDVEDAVTNLREAAVGFIKVVGIDN